MLEEGKHYILIEKIVCNVCSFGFSDLEALEQHIEDHHPGVLNG